MKYKSFFYILFIIYIFIMNSEDKSEYDLKDEVYEQYYYKYDPIIVDIVDNNILYTEEKIEYSFIPIKKKPV